MKKKNENIKPIIYFILGFATFICIYIVWIMISYRYIE